MPRTFFDISMSLDGFVAGPDVGPDQGLGEGRERFHDWAVGTKGFQEAAGDRDVAIGGGADVIQQALRAGLVDEFMLHVVAIFLGRGTRLFDDLAGKAGLECTRVIESPQVTHLGYRAAA